MSKSAKKRFCPVVQREISSAECGENRVSRYACPDDCPFNPYAPANYEMALALDDSLNDKSTRYFIEIDPDPAALAQQVARMQRHPSPQVLNTWITWRQFIVRDERGRTMAERWEQAGFPGLKNDERVLIKARAQTRMALIEVRRVIDGEQVEVVDLLETGRVPFVVRDRSFAAQAVRFAVLLTLCHPLPYYWRLTGAATVIQDIAQLEPEEIIRAIVQHLGGPVDEAGIRLWLIEHFERVEEALAATGLARRAQMLAAMDAKWGRVVYQLRQPFAECRARLDAHAELEPDDLAETEENEGFSDARVWFEREVNDPAIEGGIVLGRVLLGQAHWRLEAMGEARTARLRSQFESLMGSAVQFTGERLDDHALNLKNKEPHYDRNLVPPRLLEQPEKIIMTSSRVPASADPRKPKAEFQAELLREAERRFLDTRIPALDDRTPREAARDPQRRPKLIRLVKQRVRGHDQRNLETGRRDDINWLLRELELTELLFDPPPLRPPSQPEPDESAPDDPFEFAGAPLSLPLPPASSEPLSLEEVSERVQEVFENFETAKDALQGIPADGSDFISIAAELAEEPAGREEFESLLPLLVQARFVLVPPGCREPELDFDQMCLALERELRKLDQIGASSEADQLVQFFAESRQPALMQLLVAQFIEAISATRGQHQPPKPEQLFLCVLMKVMIDELDRALRG